MIVTDDSIERQSLLLRGALDMCVLALIDRGPQHAYGVVEELAGFGFEQISYGTIYPLVTRLRRQGLVDQRSEASKGGPARNVLTTTSQGQAALKRWANQWHETTNKITTLLESSATAKVMGTAHAI